MPKLSFIIPVYNTERYLGNCIKSLLDQSLKDWEAIFVLDGHSNSAESLIEQHFAGKDIPYQIHLIEHGGACRARNEGAKYAKGDYWVFWDSDCYIEPNTAKMWVEQLDEQKNIDFIYSGYAFTDGMNAIESEPFDPWLLKIRNYISTCFPFRKALFPGWNESLKSLQDWDFWLSIVEKGGKGLYLRGYAFKTELPDGNSISGKGCTSEVWLERVDAVKKAHNLPERDICVTGIGQKPDAVRLAKMIDADYQDMPESKPHRYKTIIHVGFDLNTGLARADANSYANSKLKHILFWTNDSIAALYNSIPVVQYVRFRVLLNSICHKQYVEDKEALRQLEDIGFKVEIMPLPMANLADLKPLPERPRFLVDIAQSYGAAFSVLDHCVPEYDLDLLSESAKIEEYTGILHFHLDRTMSNAMKRMLLTGRHVISNVQGAYTGYVDDVKQPEKFLEDMAHKIRIIAGESLNKKAAEYYSAKLGAENLLQVARA